MGAKESALDRKPYRKTKAEDTEVLPKDDAFHLLQNSRRRALLRYLLASNEKEPFLMKDIAERIAAWEHETTRPKLTSKERQRVYISLYQSHLPKLDKYGVITYNQDRGYVKLQPAADLLTPYLDVESGLDAPQMIKAKTEGTPEQKQTGFQKMLRLFSR